MEMLPAQRSEIDRYRIHESIGQGSFGVIYRATKIDDGEEVAIKIIDTKRLTNDEAKQQLDAELTAFSAFKDLPFVIKALNRFTYQNYQAIVMEYAPLDLEQIISAYSKLPIDFIVYILAEISHGLQAIHYRGFSDRDLKASNILIDRSGNVRITDFGTAKKIDEEEIEICRGQRQFPQLKMTSRRQENGANGSDEANGGNIQRKQAASFVGTLLFQAPEVKAAKVYYTSASDIYSLGLIAYEMCGGELLNGIEEVKTYLQELPSIYNSIKKFIMQCLEKDPCKRFQGGWPALKSQDIFRDVKFEELEEYNKINALELKKDVIEFKRTKVKLQKVFEFKSEELVEKSLPFEKYLLKQELANYLYNCEIEFEGDMKESTLLVTDFHRLLLIDKKGFVFFEEFVISQELTLESLSNTQLLIKFLSKKFIIISNEEEITAFIQFMSMFFRPFNRQFCSHCNLYSVKDMICVKCGHPAKNQTKFVYFKPTSCYVPKSESIAQTLKNQITERTQIDANRIINCTQSLKINFPTTQDLKYGEMCYILQQMNDLKTRLYFPSQAQLDGIIQAYPLPRVLCLFCDEEQNKIGSEIATFLRLLRFSVCKYGYLMNFDFELTQQKSRRDINEEELLIDRRDFEIDSSEFW